MIHALTCLLLWLHPSPADIPRLTELATIASDIGAATTDETDAEVLVAECVHESGCRLHAVGDGGAARGPWQIHGRDLSAREALARTRWSMRACGDLSLFAGFGRCGGDPAVLSSLLDPTLPRR